jgi:twitching motility two-component system response regulator PilH
MMIKKILIVDDSKTEAMITTKILQDRGYQIKNAINAEDALVQLKNEKPDLILMDVVMPGKSGFQLTRILSKDENFAAVPIILCSSKNQATDRIWGLRQGAREYITKPVSVATLLNAIKRIEGQS